MKDTIRLSVFGLGFAGLMSIACLLPSKTTEIPAPLSPEEISWVEFCKYKGYDVHTEDEEIINEFLDTWRGSPVEEEALTRQGVEV
ncbi:MAG: hypothetical protein K2J48_05355 [Muribaculaceae bacterium]|nr:hypothetical protein [Muribaculaceae bacterium]